MRAMMLTGIRKMEMREVPDPMIINDRDVLIKMTRVGVCGSDMHYYSRGKIGSRGVDYPFPVGHEGSGQIVKVGPGVTRVKPGDRIAIDPAISCGLCDQCLAGRPHTCRQLTFLGCPGEQNDGSTPHFEVKYAITDSSGHAQFNDNEAGSFSIPVLDGDGARSTTEGALVTFFDGEDSNVFYAEHPDFNTPGFEVFTGIDSSSSTATDTSENILSLSLTSYTWQGWRLNSDNGARHEAARDYVDWAAQEGSENWGYYGCTTFKEMEDGHKFFSVVYAGAEKLGIVAAVNSISESITSALQIITGELETYEAEECEAFQFFGFIPNHEEWTTPTGGIVVPYCYTPHETETYTDNGIDDDCDGIIDEGGVGDDDDDAGDDDDDTSPDDVCTGTEQFCDGFEDGVVGSDWDEQEGSVSESDGKLKLEDHTYVRAAFQTELVSNEYSFKLESEIVSGEDYSIGISNNDWGWVRLEHRYGNLSASCYDYVLEEMVEGNTISLSSGTVYGLEISVYGGHSSVFIGNDVIFSQDNCWMTVDTRLEIQLDANNDGVQLEHILVEDF